MFFVVNTLRPDTSCVEDIINLVKAIEYTSRCKVTSLVNNTNLSYLSSAKDITDSLKLVEEVGEILNLPVKYISGTKENLDGADIAEDKKFPLELFMQLPFDATV